MPLQYIPYYSIWDENKGSFLQTNLYSYKTHVRKKRFARKLTLLLHAGSEAFAQSTISALVPFVFVDLTFSHKSVRSKF